MKSILKNKKAIELSVNMIVVLIISIVVFTLGIFFVKQIYSYATKTTNDVGEEFDASVQDLLCENREIVCIPKDSADLAQEKNPYYGVVITYVGNTATQDFKLIVENSIYLDKMGASTTNNFPSANIKYVAEKFTVKNNGVAKKKIALVPTGVKSGTYAFNVKVMCTDGSGNTQNCNPIGNTYPEQYGPTQKIYLYVP